MQRGAVPPLINMLKTNDRALREMAAFALGRLAQNTDNQAGIFAMGVLQPLLDLLSSKVKNLEHNAAFTLYGLADNSDNVSEIVKWVRRVAAHPFFEKSIELFYDVRTHVHLARSRRLSRFRSRSAAITSGVRGAVCCRSSDLAACAEHGWYRSVSNLQP